MNSSKRIRVYGTDYADILMYLAGIMNCLNRTVLVRNLCEDRKLRSCIPIIENIDIREKVYRACGLDYTESDTEDEDGHDCVIDVGPKDENGPGESDIDLMVTSEDRCDADELMRTAALPGEDPEHRKTVRILVIRNCSGYIRGLADELKKSLGADRVFKIPYSPRDRKSELLCQYKEGCAFSGITAALEEIPEELVFTLWPDTGNKEYAKALRRAKRGERI